MRRGVESRAGRKIVLGDFHHNERLAEMQKGNDQIARRISEEAKVAREQEYRDIYGDLGDVALALATRDTSSDEIVVEEVTIHVDEARLKYASLLTETLSSLHKSERVQWVVDFMKDTDRVIFAKDLGPLR